MTVEIFSNDKFLDAPSDLRTGRYITIFLLRETKSQCIFRTDEGICSEITRAGLVRNELIDRVLITKRKQTAPERRNGRELLRYYGVNHDCEINTENMCGKCIDCNIYGSAVGKGVSRKSHIITDETFSLLPFWDIVTENTFNALFENGTMVSDDGKPSQAIQKNEVVRPGAFFLEMETIADVTKEAFLYALANILRTKKYGAMTSRLGDVNNKVIGIVISNCELFSNLEWIQKTYDAYCVKSNISNEDKPQFPLDGVMVESSARETIDELLETISGDVLKLNDDQVAEIIEEVERIYSDKDELGRFLADLDAQFNP